MQTSAYEYYSIKLYDNVLVSSLPTLLYKTNVN